MNQLPLSKRAEIINLLVDGNSLRATTRITGCSINTITKLLIEAGKACQTFHNDHVVFLQSKNIQVDEIWSFVYAKEKNVPGALKENAGVGDVWTWTALDADSKFIVSWLVGDRSVDTGRVFMKDVVSRLANRIQLISDGRKVYLVAVDTAFNNQIDFAQLVKIYGQNDPDKRYIPFEYTGIKKSVISCNPDKNKISTPFVDLQNLTMRMHMRRFTTLTNAFSKKVENHCFAVALHFVYYNFVKVHKTLRVTPAMEAGLAKKPMNIEDIVNLTNNSS